MITVGILSFSDGRERVHNSLAPYIKECEDNLKAVLEGTEKVRVITASGIICNSRLAAEMAEEMVSHHPDAIILNIPVFAFPNFAAIAVTLLNVPVLAISPVNGAMPGLGGLQAAVNMIRQTGGKCGKVWGNIQEEKTLGKVMTFLKAAYAATSLKGQIYGLIGGRSIGMGSGAVNPDVWMNIFGVDVDHVDQLEIIRRTKDVDCEKVNRAFKWLGDHMGAILYDDDKLTVDSLKMQIRCYFATKDIIDERKLDFVGVKCHYELSEYYVTQCLSAALFNDPYDWDGPKEPLVYACEADSDAALTMQIMKLISDEPVLFFDFRHYDPKDQVFAFCNCGAMSTWYAKRGSAIENLRNVKLCPIISKYGGKGCHVQFMAREGEMTFARLSRVLDKYKLILFKGTLKEFPAEKMEETCFSWPHAFASVQMDPENLIDRYESNHIHAVYGDFVAELTEFCKIKGIDYEVII